MAHFHERTRGIYRQGSYGFNASQDRIEVEAVTMPISGFTDSVYSAVNEGIGPDIIFHYASEASKYVDAGQLIDLGQYIYDPEIGEGFDDSLTEAVMRVK